MKEGRITDHTLASLVKCPRLETLFLAGEGVTDAGLKYIQEMQHLHTLRLTAPRVTDKGIAFLGDARQLRELQLRCDRITDLGVSSLKHLPLKLLAIEPSTPFSAQGNFLDVTDEPLEAIIDNAHLRELRLIRTAITDAGIHALGKSKSIEKIILYESFVTEKSADQFVNDNPRISLQWLSR
jgi:hypothetical protein